MWCIMYDAVFDVAYNYSMLYDCSIRVTALLKHIESALKECGLYNAATSTSGMVILFA